MSRSLHKAFDLRHMSDYRELAEVTIEDANTVLREAKNFIKKVKKYFVKEI